MSTQENSPAFQQLDALSKRAAALAVRRTRAQVQLETAALQYSQAVTESIAKHKTSNIDELRSKLKQLEAENAQIITDYTKALDDLESFLNRIEEALASPEAMAALLTALEAEGRLAPENQPAKPEAPVAVAASSSFAAEDI